MNTSMAEKILPESKMIEFMKNTFMPSDVEFVSHKAYLKKDISQMVLILILENMYINLMLAIPITK